MITGCISISAFASLKIVLLAKIKLSRIEVLISKGLNDSYISHNEFVSVNDVLREYDDLEKDIKNLKDFNNFDKILI